MARYIRTLTGVCAKEVSFSIDNGIVHNVEFTGGCNGNGKAVCALVDGMHVSDVINRLASIKCGTKNTSCPAKLAESIQIVLDAH